MTIILVVVVMKAAVVMIIVMTGYPRALSLPKDTLLVGVRVKDCEWCLLYAS